MKISISVGGRKLNFVVPNSGDVDIDVTDLDGVVSNRVFDLNSASLGVRRLYRSLQNDVDANGNVSIDVPSYCESLGMLPVVLGRHLGWLEREGVVCRGRRRRASSGKVLSHELKLLISSSSGGTDSEAVHSLWSSTIDDISSELGDEAADLFVALCKMSDIDGNLIASTLEILAHMNADVPFFPSSKLSSLEVGGWISVDDIHDNGILGLSILGFSKLSEGFPWEENG